jgi:hypothetical protein
MADIKQAAFDGWAVVDVLGHQRYAGYVTTEAYGAAVLFRIDVPALGARERVTKTPRYVNGHGYVPAGTSLTEGAVDGYSKLIGAGSIYAITPCTKDAALIAVEEIQPRPLMNVVVPPKAELSAGELVDCEVDDDHDDDEDEFENERDEA